MVREKLRKIVAGSCSDSLESLKDVIAKLPLPFDPNNAESTAPKAIGATPQRIQEPIRPRSLKSVAKDDALCAFPTVLFSPLRKWSVKAASSPQRFRARFSKKARAFLARLPSSSKLTCSQTVLFSNFASVIFRVRVVLLRIIPLDFFPALFPPDWHWTFSHEAVN